MLVERSSCRCGPLSVDLRLCLQRTQCVLQRRSMGLRWCRPPRIFGPSAFPHDSVLMGRFPLDPRYRGRLGVVTHPLHSPKYGVRFVCGVRAGAGSGGETHVARRVQRCARPVTVRHAQRPVVRLSTRIADPASDQSLFAPHRATLRVGRAWLDRLCACWRLCSGRVCVYVCYVRVLKNTGFGISRLAALLELEYCNWLGAQLAGRTPRAHLMCSTLHGTHTAPAVLTHGPVPRAKL